MTTSLQALAAVLDVVNNTLAQRCYRYESSRLKKRKFREIVVKSKVYSH